jgi:hypothetical protein
VQSPALFGQERLAEQRRPVAIEPEHAFDGAQDARPGLRRDAHEHDEVDDLQRGPSGIHLQRRQLGHPSHSPEPVHRAVKHLDTLQNVEPRRREERADPVGDRV